MFRLLCFIAQPRTLLNTKPVLFVNHHSAKALEIYRILNQCMGTNCNVNGTVCDSSQNIASLLPRYFVGEQFNSQRTVAKQIRLIRHRERRKQRTNTQRMLVCQYLGWRHNCCLMSALH